MSKLSDADKARYVEALARHAEALIERREKIAEAKAPMPLRATPLGVIDPKTLREPGRDWCDDPELAFRYLAIREIGWELYALGGIDLMCDVFDDLYDRGDRTGPCVDHRWDGLGTKSGGKWYA